MTGPVELVKELDKSSEGGRQLAGTSSRPPKYQEIGTTLMEAILSGDYPPGSYLPSESALMKRFGVSRVTIRLALNVLRDASLIVGHQGKGYFVCTLQAVQDLGRLQGFGELMAPLGVETRSEVLSGEVVPAPAAAAAALNLKRGVDLVKIRRVRIAAGEAMSIDVSYFPLSIGRKLLDMDLAHADIFTLIETRIGIEIGFADITMTVVPADADVGRLLNVKAGDGVIRTERLTHDASGQPIDYEYLFVRPDCHQFKIRVPRW
ncbi:GntR family transcriptional regulator [Roseibium salinum]|uniref:GntR family transcriptional regulator n=1 Tax=Roseibium salinum TaxID=1604349 RepID=A0ABT3QVJ9_9HYPH|nr:GntR family transcriptional regulator [Roseibium sp. DSM 29163]MCX2720948.1 GntR family transcriptional regulator [Roseibium sp. DSM 29163]MDN3722408.1 GntR family transcriptional regulator [Roseibium salinum]